MATPALDGCVNVIQKQHWYLTLQSIFLKRKFIFTMKKLITNYVTNIDNEKGGSSEKVNKTSKISGGLNTGPILDLNSSP